MMYLGGRLSIKPTLSKVRKGKLDYNRAKIGNTVDTYLPYRRLFSDPIDPWAMSSPGV